MILFFRQDFGQVLLLPDQVVVDQLRRYGPEPLLVRHEEEEAREVLLVDALHRLFLETIFYRQGSFLQASWR